MVLHALSLLTILFTSGYVLMMLFMARGWSMLSAFKIKDARQPQTAVSVVMAARNEAAGIHLTIEDILAQNYPKELLEIIIVDDNSTDATSEIIKSYANRGVTLITMKSTKPFNSYKKKAITEAIELSAGKLIVATDADCRMGKDWLKTVALFYEENNLKLVSSPVTFFEERNMFEDIQTLEFLFLIGFGASSIGNKMPATCNGANLAYEREVFFELGGFKGIDDLASGDDELFMHKVADRYPGDIGFCKSHNAFVYTHAKHDLREFIVQRKRWASKSTKYSDKRIVALGIFVWLTYAIFLFNLVFGILNPNYRIVAIGSLMAKFAVELIFMTPVTRFAKRMELLLYVPIASVLHTVYIIYIGIAGNSGKYAWKDRMVR